MRLLALIFLFIFAGIDKTLAVTPPATCMGSYKVAVNESEPLYFQPENSRDFVGVSLDTVNELRARTTCKFATIPINRSRLRSELRSYRVDLVVVTVQNPVFDEIANFVPIQKVQRQAFTSKAIANEHKTFQEMIDDPKVSFIVLPAAAFFFTSEEIKKLRKAERFITAPSLQSCYQTLKKTPHGAVVQNDWVHKYFEKTQSLVGYETIPDTKNFFDIGIYYRDKERVEDIQVITQALNDMVKDGTWQKITDNYADFKTPALIKK
ncbi:transporter substrate-binding domain-containing protein [Bdellovibrio sp. SKB1291214]|uniref:transporter substrate-binding domain-containing protein n=1 Tax=Bdellovibrio sp. SKB1291214 TaxID=1732569 RepID=UPI000B51E55F|nr:transporter substrate-binding domain-containing protein [Bdellovibrio sp. SKB1291214]UYL08727.1 transporter substrate-binding domain-containing protein [Bdellovibrio sp. SKB1291214]